MMIKIPIIDYGITGEGMIALREYAKGGFILT
jgi:hypothetical protein